MDKLLRVWSATVPECSLRLGRSVGLRSIRSSAEDMSSPSSGLERVLRCNRSLLAGYRYGNLSGVMTHRSAISEIFRLSLDLDSQLEQWWNEQTPSTPLLGLHVRMGDYERWRGGIYYRDWDWYADFALEMLQLSGCRQVLVTSNDVVPESFSKRVNAIHGPGSGILDMYALGRCAAIAGPPSTFSLWAALISDTEIYHFGSEGTPRFEAVSERLLLESVVL